MTATPAFQTSAGVARRDFASLFARLVVGGVFLYASLDKIAHPDLFAKAIFNYRLVPGWGINLLAILLPWIEVAAALLLLLGLFARAAALLLGSMTVVFVLAMGSAMARGLDIHCGCFNLASSGGHAVWPQILGDLVLLVLIARVYRRGPGAFAIGKS